MPEGQRTRWTDDRLSDKFESLEKRINSLPDRVTVMESKLGNVADDVRDCNQEVKTMHNEWRAARQGLTRGEKIALLGSSAGFVGALVAAVALLSGAGG